MDPKQDILVNLGKQHRGSQQVYFLFLSKPCKKQFVSNKLKLLSVYKTNNRLRIIIRQIDWTP